MLSEPQLHTQIPNVSVQFVLFDHCNLACPHLMIFALENIPPITELSLDYGVIGEMAGGINHVVFRAGIHCTDATPTHATSSFHTAPF